MLRNYDESQALRTEAGSAKRAVVIGAGFIGCEVTASLRTLAVEVVLVEPQPQPLASVLGEQIGALVARLHRAEGVDVRTGIGVKAVHGDGRVEKVVLSDDSEIDADLVIVGIGSRPATDWLEGTGIEVDNGVVCDKAGQTTAPACVGVGRCRLVAGCDRTSGPRRALEQCCRAGPCSGAGPAGPGATRGRRGALLLERSVRRQDPVPR